MSTYNTLMEGPNAATDLVLEQAMDLILHGRASDDEAIRDAAHAAAAEIVRRNIVPPPDDADEAADQINAVEEAIRYALSRA